MDVLSDFSLTKTLFVIALLAAASFDIASYRIPNTIVVLLLLGFVIVSLAVSAEVDWLDHLIAGTGLFVAGILFYSLGQMGAGDVKLLGAIALWGGTGALLPLVFWISVSGLLVIIVLLSLRRLMPLLQGWRAISLPASLPKVLVPGEGVPYGVAICLGTLIAISMFPAWLWYW
jgi:prepilin peptidase CpaA